MTEIKAVTALVEALNASIGVKALRDIAHPRYIMREMRPHTAPDGSIVLTLSLRGFEYKARRHGAPRPKTPPRIDTEAIKAVLTLSLYRHGLAVKKIEKFDTYFDVTIYEYEEKRCDL